MVELLVVIGIIAVLIGLLMPALNRARKQANLVACRATLADLGKTFQMYLDDSRGHLPWVDTLPVPASGLSTMEPVTTVFGPYIGAGVNIWKCPMDFISTAGYPIGAPPGYTTWFDMEGSSYTYSNSLSPQWSGYTLQETRQYRKNQQNRLVIFTDYEPFHGLAGTNGSENYLFSDMHVGDLADE